MLDDSDAAKEQMEVVKGKLQRICNATGEDSGAELELLPPGFILPADLVDPSVAVTEVSHRAESRDRLFHADTFRTKAIETLKALRQRMRENTAKKDLMNFESRWCCSDSPFLIMVGGRRLANGVPRTRRSQFVSSIPF